MPILSVKETLLNNVTITGTQTSNTESRNKGQHEYLIYYIDITGVTGGSAKMSATIQSSPDGVTWYDIETAVDITAAGYYVTKSVNFGNYVRLKYVLTGTTPVFSGVSIKMHTKG